MKQYDYILGTHHQLSEALDQVIERFNHRRRHNNTTAYEDIQIVNAGVVFTAVLIISYDDYKPDTSQAPPSQPKFIGQPPESGSFDTMPPSPFLQPTDHSDS